MKRGTVLELVVGALLIGLTLAATMIMVPLAPFPLYFNLGEIVVYTAALVFGWRFGLAAGAVGAACADVVLGYAMWAPITFVVKGVEGLLVGILSSGRGGWRDIVAVVVGALWMIAGYSLSAYAMFGWGGFVHELPLDVLQCAVGGVAALGLAAALRRAMPWAREFRGSTGGAFAGRAPDERARGAGR